MKKLARATTIVTGTAILLAGMTSLARSAPGDTELISVDPGSSAGTGTGIRPQMSADGRFIAFNSGGSLVPDDNNLASDVFVRDRQSGTTELVSVSTNGAQANADSFLAAISADGRYVVFNSEADNLVPGDTNVRSDVFVRDRQSGLTERVSVDANGSQFAAFSKGGSLSSDGRYVAFTSKAPLVPEDTNGKFDCFVKDRQTGAVERVNVSSSGVVGDHQCIGVRISANGRFALFGSASRNLVPGDRSGNLNAYLRDLEKHTTEVVGLTSDGQSMPGSPSSISADGRYVVFQSFDRVALASNAYVRDRKLARTEQVSVNSSGAGTNGNVLATAISDDGRTVAFSSLGDNLVPGDTNGVFDVFTRDRLTRQTRRMSVSSAGEQANDHSEFLALSADGRYLAFDSDASDLVDNDPNTFTDIFFHERTLLAYTLGPATLAFGTHPLNSTAMLNVVVRNTGNARLAIKSISISDSGASQFSQTTTCAASLAVEAVCQISVVFKPTSTGAKSASLILDRRSTASANNKTNWPGELIMNKHARSMNIDRYPRRLSIAACVLLSGASAVAQGAPGDNELISVPPGGDQAGGGLHSAMSADGRYVAFSAGPQVFVRDRQSGTTELVSQSTGGAECNEDCFLASISMDGRYVVFVSEADSLVSDDTNLRNDVFLRDRQSGITERVSVDGAGLQANDASSAGSVSADGRLVAFTSKASNLVPDDTNGKYDCFVKDRQTGLIERVSVSSSGVQASHECLSPSISADGRFAVFTSRARNLVPGDRNRASDIFVRDLQAHRTELVSSDAAGDPMTGSSGSISADGRYVAFIAIGLDGNVYVRDRQLGRTEKASVNASGAGANNFTHDPALSADGRTVAFVSLADNLISGDTNGVQDIYIRDLLTHQTRRMNVGAQGEQGSGFTEFPSINADGRYVAFDTQDSFASNDPNTGSDVYLHERTLLAYTLSPTTLAFGNHPVGSTTTLNVRLRNTGNAKLPIKSMSITGSATSQFTQTTTCPSSLAVDAVCQIRVTFKPSSTGAKSATLILETGGGLPSRLIKLTGRGQ